MFQILAEHLSCVDMFNSYSKLTGSTIKATLITAILAISFVFVIGLSNNVYPASFSDRDRDGMSDEQENDIALSWLPYIYADASDDCLPLVKYDPGWCEKYDANSQYHSGAYHQVGYIGYDVIDIGFCNLIAIEYTLFLDYQCKDVSWFFKEHHFFENEGFTLLLRRNHSGPSDYELLSAKTIGHHKTNGETSDKLYPHEVQGWINNGKELLSAENTHAIYVHHDVCARMFKGFENCGEKNSRILINPLCEIGPYDTTPCPTQENIDSLTAYTHVPDCWSKRLHLLGSTRYEDGVWCHPWEDGETRLQVRRKQLPPWIPLGVSLPENLAYVDLFLEKNFTAPSDRQKECERQNFGDALVDAGLPLRLISFPDYDWWREYYDPSYQLSERDEVCRGLAKEGLRYGYLKPCNGIFRDKVDYWKDVESLILHGLPGTILTLYDHDAGVFEYYSHMIIPDGRRTVEVRELDSLSEGMNNSVEFVTWGFGPTAYAGPDRRVTCGDRVTLDGTGSYKYALDIATVMETFKLQAFDYSEDWAFDWFDETYNRYLGRGDTLETDLCCGKHTIRLEVSGVRIPQPDKPYLRVHGTASDWCTINVELEAPKKVMLVSVCDAIEVYWDTVLCAFGYKVHRDGEFLADVGKNAYCVDTISGEHEYQVFSYDIWRNECASAPIIGVAQKCVVTDESERLPDFVNQNYPNPFNISTRIEYSLSKGGNVRLWIYNALGQRIRTLIDQFQESGHHSVIWDGTDDQGATVSSGIYFYQLQTDNFSTRKKMLLVK